MIDYGGFAERLAVHRANQDPAKRWDLYREFALLVALRTLLHAFAWSAENWDTEFEELAV